MPRRDAAPAVVIEPKRDYRGLSYDDCQAEAERLMQEALKAKRFHHLPERLKQLREIMMAHLERRCA